MRIAVIGLGGTGSAAARVLARDGHAVVGYERFGIGHDRGSSHGESRIIRYTYPDPLYTAMMADAYPLWAELEKEAGESLFVRCGGLFFGRQGDPQVRLTEEALIAERLPYERLSGPEASERFPALRLAEDEVAIHQGESGFLRSKACVLANVRLARAYGADLYEEAVVSQVVQRDEEVIVSTSNGGEERFDRAIVAAGPWIGRLAPQLNLPLAVTRQQIIYLAIARDEGAFQPGAMPVWIDASTNFYGFPFDGRIPGAKIASHNQGQVVDPNSLDRIVDRAYIDSVIAYAERRLPALAPVVTHSKVCLYTNTPNEDFVLDRMPGSPNILLVSGCSGHGFKFTVLLGDIAARLATGRTYARPLDRFRIGAHQ